MKLFYKILLVFFYNYYLFSNTINENTFWIQLKKILEDHPKINSQFLKLSLEIKNYHFAKRTYPDPKFGIMWKDAPYNKNFKLNMNRYEMSGIEYSLIQPIPTPGKLNQMAKIQQKEIEQERLNLAMMYNQFAKDIIKIILDYHYDSEILNLLKDFQKKFETLKETSKIRYSTGSGNFSDYSKTLVLEKKIEQERINLENLIQTNEKKWEYYSSSLDYRDQKIFNSTKEYINYLYKNNKNLEEEIQNSVYLNFAKILPEIEKEKVSLQKFEYYPDFEIFFSYLKRERIKSTIASEEEFLSSLNSPSGEDLMSFGIMFRIPLWSAISNPKKVNSIELAYQKEKENISEIYLNLKFKIQEIKISILNLERQIEISEKHLIPYAELSYQSTLQNYTVGKVDFDSLIFSMQDLFEIQKDLIIKKRQWNNQIIEYLELTNQILPEIQILNNPKEVPYENK
ncbi:MAG: TolC family protein [Leptonema sp. (in: bacteria)]